MTWTRFGIGFAAVGAVVLGALAVHTVSAAPAGAGAWDGQGRPGVAQLRARFQEMRAFQEELNLTDEQRATLQALAETYKEQNAQLIADLQAGRDAVKTLMRADVVDEEAITAAVSGLNELLGAAAVQVAYFRQDASGILTPEQMALIEAKLDERGERGFEGHGDFLGTLGDAPMRFGPRRR